MSNFVDGCQLFLGDCLSSLPNIPNNSVDMVLADPPYGTTQCKWDSVIDLSAMWRELERVCKPNAAIVMTAAQPFSSILGASNIRNLRYSWVWEKSAATGHLNAKRMPMKNHEDVLVFYKKQPTYNPQGLQEFGKVTRRGGNGGCYGKSGVENLQQFTNYPRTIQKFASEGKTVHSTQKPTSLMEYLIKTYTNSGDTVLDITMGSGTTGVACINTGREFIGMEMDAEIFQVAKERIASII